MIRSASEPLDLLWFCQLTADGEFIGARPERKPMLHYMSSLVETAAEMGFSSLLTASVAALATGVAPVT